MKYAKHHWHAFYDCRKKNSPYTDAVPTRRARATPTTVQSVTEDGFTRATRKRLGKYLRYHAQPGGHAMPGRPGVPRPKRLHKQGSVSFPDLSVLHKSMAPYGLSRARVHASWSDFAEPPLPKIAETPEDWQGRVQWAGRFEKVSADIVIDPEKPHLLGAGKSGQVMRMRERATGRDVAVKKFLDPEGFSGHAASRARNEFEVAHNLRHPHIVAPFDVAVDAERGKAFLVYPLVSGMTLAKSPRLAEPEAKQVFRDILGALAYMFENQVNHNDLHGNNIMVRHGRGYLIDFGFASRSADVLCRNDLRDLRDTMSYFFPSARSAEGLQFFGAFKKRLDPATQRLKPETGAALMQAMLQHPYLKGL